MAVELLSNEYKCLLHGALLLANGLEVLDIKIAHEFGWDSSITDIKRVHFNVKKENIELSNAIDEYLEEEFNVSKLNLTVTKMHFNVIPDTK